MHKRKKSTHTALETIIKKATAVKNTAKDKNNRDPQLAPEPPHKRPKTTPTFATRMGNLVCVQLIIL